MSHVPCCMGIDVAKAQMGIAIRPSGTRWIVPNDADSTGTLVKRVQSLLPTLIVREATGGLKRATVWGMISRHEQWGIVRENNAGDQCHRGAFPTGYHADACTVVRGLSTKLIGRCASQRRNHPKGARLFYTPQR